MQWSPNPPVVSWSPNSHLATNSIFFQNHMVLHISNITPSFFTLCHLYSSPRDASYMSYAIILPFYATVSTASPKFLKYSPSLLLTLTINFTLPWNVAKDVSFRSWPSTHYMQICPLFAAKIFLLQCTAFFLPKFNRFYRTWRLWITNEAPEGLHTALQVV